LLHFAASPGRLRRPTAKRWAFRTARWRAGAGSVVKEQRPDFGNLQDHTKQFPDKSSDIFIYPSLQRVAAAGVNVTRKSGGFRPSAGCMFRAAGSRSSSFKSVWSIARPGFRRVCWASPIPSPRRFVAPRATSGIGFVPSIPHRRPACHVAPGCMGLHPVAIGFVFARAPAPAGPRSPGRRDDWLCFVRSARRRRFHQSACRRIPSRGKTPSSPNAAPTPQCLKLSFYQISLLPSTPPSPCRERCV